MLPSVLPRLTTDLAVRVFPGVWKLLSFLRLPTQDRAPSLPLLPLFLFFIFFLPPFEDNGLFSGCTTSAPSQADVDHSEPQEVLVSKETYLQFGR